MASQSIQVTNHTQISHQRKRVIKEGLLEVTHTFSEMAKFPIIFWRSKMPPSIRNLTPIITPSHTIISWVRPLISLSTWWIRSHSEACSHWMQITFVFRIHKAIPFSKTLSEYLQTNKPSVHTVHTISLSTLNLLDSPPIKTKDSSNIKTARNYSSLSANFHQTSIFVVIKSNFDQSRQHGPSCECYLSNAKLRWKNEIEKNLGLAAPKGKIIEGKEWNTYQSLALAPSSKTSVEWSNPTKGSQGFEQFWNSYWE